MFELCDLNNNNNLDLYEFESCATINKDCFNKEKSCKTIQNDLVNQIFYKYANKINNVLDIDGLNKLIISYSSN